MRSRHARHAPAGLLVGTDAKAQALPRRLLPDRVLDRLSARELRG